jgi:hypothetical protein
MELTSCSHQLLESLAPMVLGPVLLNMMPTICILCKALVTSFHFIALAD